jgi:hypothetical protein
MEDGRLRIKDEDSSDSLLEGLITKYEKSPFLYDEYEEVSDYRVLIGIEVRFTDMTRDRILWVTRFEEWAHYPADGEEDDGIELALEQLKERLIREVSEEW